MADATTMNQIELMLLLGAMGSLRQDEIVARQAVINHQGASQLCVLAFVRDATEMSIPESYAVQGLAASQTPRDVAGLQTAAGTPAQGSVTNNLGKPA